MTECVYLVIISLLNSIDAKLNVISKHAVPVDDERCIWL